MVTGLCGVNQPHNPLYIIMLGMMTTNSTLTQFNTGFSLFIMIGGKITQVIGNPLLFSLIVVNSLKKLCTQRIMKQGGIAGHHFLL